MNNKFTNLGVLLGAVSLISFAFNACSKFAASIEKSELTLEMSDLGSTNTVADIPAGFPVEFTFNDAVSINLGDQRKIMATVTALPGFNGSLRLAVDRTLLNTLDPQQNLTVTPAEVSIDLLEGETKSQEFTITSKTMTKVGMGEFKFLVSPTSGSYQGLIEGSTRIVVNPLYQINLSGPADGTLMVWSSGAAGSSVDFSPNPGGVIIRFVNIDPLQVHRIHATPNKYHEPNNLGVNGQIYDITVTETTTNFQVPYHCHIHAAADRILRFNVVQ